MRAMSYLDYLKTLKTPQANMALKRHRKQKEALLGVYKSTEEGKRKEKIRAGKNTKANLFGGKYGKN